MLDEHGMPVPIKMTPLPWRLADEVDVVDADGEMVCDCNSTEGGAEFLAHAANNIIECREIVRRLAEPDNLSLSEIEAVIRDATILWAEMLKGGSE